MKFSIVVPTWNRAELVEKCIGNNLSNMGVSREEVELVWVDDGSTDNVREIMKEFKPDVSVIKEKNEGVFKAYNIGYSLTTGDWIIHMGSDIIFPDKWLATIKDYIEKIPESAGIGILINDFFDSGDQYWGGNKRVINGKTIIEAKNFMGVYAFSRELFQEVGYLDEGFGWYGPGDWDWSDRVKNTGKLLYYLPEEKVIHLGTEDCAEMLDKKGRWAARGDIILDEKRVNIPNRVYYTPFMIDKYQKRYLKHREEKEKGRMEEYRKGYTSEEKDTFLKILKNRRSQRGFDGRTVPKEKLNLLLESIRLAPSSCNRQAIYIKICEQIEDILVGGKGWINGANKIFLIFASRKAYKSPAEIEFMPYLDAGVVVENLYLMAESLGIGSCFVNPNIRPESINKFNELYNREEEIFCGAMAFGYHTRIPNDVPKREIKDIVK